MENKNDENEKVSKIQIATIVLICVAIVIDVISIFIR